VEFCQVVTVMVVSPLAVAAVLLVDERRLRGEKLARAWLPATRDATIYGASQVSPLYGCVGLIVHFTKTRASLAGFGLGALWALAVFYVDVASTAVTAWVIDWLGL
jgi:hypothetical protein